jgi:hypothetical protein
MVVVVKSPPAVEIVIAPLEDVMFIPEPAVRKDGI